MGRLANVILPVLTLVLGVAIGKWWGESRDATAAPRPQLQRTPTQAQTPSKPGSLPQASKPIAGATEAVPVPTADETPGQKGARVVVLSPTGGPVGARTTKEAGKPNSGAAAAPVSEPKGNEQDEAASKMLAVLFTNPAMRGKILDQLVAQVDARVKFSDSQREAAKRELGDALTPLVEMLQKGPAAMRDLDPKFEEVKADWKRRLTPLLTAEQGSAFQAWLDEKHSLSIKMGVDEKGEPVDPDEGR